MPRYDFHCSACDTSREVTVPIAARPDHLTCGCCGGVATRQFPRRTTFRLGPDVYEAAYQRGDMAAPE
ncbi:MAG: hypothetical protein IIA59_12160 [Candidatus Marinimicrobia bacterium]|nr:hypothetical protein [Candidatus Neomarinimicrobiota bacterium]